MITGIKNCNNSNKRDSYELIGLLKSQTINKKHLENYYSLNNKN